MVEIYFIPNNDIFAGFIITRLPDVQHDAHKKDQ